MTHIGFCFGEYNKSCHDCPTEAGCLEMADNEKSKKVKMWSYGWVTGSAWEHPKSKEASGAVGETVLYIGTEYEHPQQKCGEIVKEFSEVSLLWISKLIICRL